MAEAGAEHAEASARRHARPRCRHTGQLPPGVVLPSCLFLVLVLVLLPDRAGTASPAAARAAAGGGGGTSLEAATTRKVRIHSIVQ